MLGTCLFQRLFCLCDSIWAYPLHTATKAKLSPGLLVSNVVSLSQNDTIVPNSDTTNAVVGVIDTVGVFVVAAIIVVGVSSVVLESLLLIFLATVLLLLLSYLWLFG